MNQLLTADISQVPIIIEQIEPYRQWADPLLESELASVADGSVEKLHFALALMPVADEQVDFLSGELPFCTLDQLPVVREALLPHKDEMTDGLWQLVQD